MLLQKVDLFIQIQKILLARMQYHLLLNVSTICMF